MFVLGTSYIFLLGTSYAFVVDTSYIFVLARPIQSVEEVEVADARARGVRQLRLLLTALCFSFDARFSEPNPVAVHLSDFRYRTKGI